MTDEHEPLNQIAQQLDLPWWFFAVATQILVIVAFIIGLLGLWWWQSGKAEPGARVRWRPLPEQPLLAGLSAFAGLLTAACALYCLIWWPKPPAPRILEPDASVLCWLYCGVFMTWPWAMGAMVNGVVLVAAGGLLLGRFGSRRAGAWLAVIAGLVAFPVGILGVYAGNRALRTAV